MKSLLLSVLLATATLNLGQTANLESADRRCLPGRTQPVTGFWTWPAGLEVNVYLQEPDFSIDHAPAVELAVKNWNATAAVTGSRVHFTLRGMTRIPQTALGDLTIVRGDVFKKNEKHLALIEAHSLRHDRLIDYARVIVDYRVTNPAVLTDVIAHELGHSLGLMDCYECKGQTTAMGLIRGANETNRVAGPTACDVVAVRLVYRELAERFKSEAVTKLKKVDEGEDPAADDTPATKPPR